MGQPWMLVRAAAILLVTRQTLALSDIFEEGKSDKEILDNLLRATRYDKRLLPPVQDADFCCGLQSPEDAKFDIQNIPASSKQRGTLRVNVTCLLLSLASPDESSLKYEVEFLLQQQWFDPRLQYSNQSRYDFLNAIHHYNDIWLPDTYFIMHGDFKDPLIPMHFSLRIFRNGSVSYLMRRHLILSCQGNLNIFPFDDPECSFSMESISYEASMVDYVWKNDEDVLRKSPSLQTLNAYLIKNTTGPCNLLKSNWRVDGHGREDGNEIQSFNNCHKICEGNYSCLRVDLIFTRDRAFYFTTVFIPGIILVTSSFITFWLEWNAVPARVMIGVTTMLNFFTTSNGFRSTLPVVSNLTAMNVWDGVCMCFIYASLLEFVCVNYVGRKRPLHNVVYRPGENPVIQGRNGPRFYQWLLIRLYVVWSVMLQRLPAVLSRIGIILASPLWNFGTPEPMPKKRRLASSLHCCTRSCSSDKGPVPSCSQNEEERVTPEFSVLNETAEQEYYSTFCESPQYRGDKKRDSTGVANEIVSCTNCGPNPCTHTANNGCAAEVRKKEPPHPIRVAKTIDVIARITFPTAFAVFLVFFFYHYNTQH